MMISLALSSITITISIVSHTSSQSIYYDSHMHTPLCKHAVGQPVDYARVGRQRGLKGIIITCHSPMPNGFSRDVRMRPEELPEYVDLVNSASQELQGEIEVKLGMESDWFPGMEHWLAELHHKADFHFILGSVHPFTREYKEAYYHKDPTVFQSVYFSHLADAAESGLFDCLSHPDIVKVMIGDHWDFSAAKSTIESALKRISSTGIAMELNTSGLNKSYPEMNPGTEMLCLMKELGIPVVVNSDAHAPERVGADFNVAFNLLENIGYTEISYFHNRKRHTVLISEASSSMNFDPR